MVINTKLMHSLSFKGMEHVPKIFMSFDKVFVFRSDKHPHLDWSI